jgi:malate dehydrogenase (oxaloacetate-decarboxylating)
MMGILVSTIRNSKEGRIAVPGPEVDPASAGRHAAVVATGPSDFPNQISN